MRPKISEATAPSRFAQAGWGEGAVARTLLGVLLTIAIAAAAFALRFLPGIASFSPMVLAVLIGVTIRNTIGLPKGTQAGITFSVRRILRFAIVLLGMQLTVEQVIALGASGAIVIVASLAATFLFTAWFATLIGVERKLAYLIGAGTAVCGASAVVATNAVTAAADEDVSYAVASVTVFGTLAMFAYPPLATAIALGPHDYGLWAGASIHEIAQVVAAAFQHGQYAGEFATLAKLSRVILLAPLVLSLGYFSRTAAEPGGGNARPPIPWFVVAFIGVIGLNSLISPPAEVRSWCMIVTAFLLSVALAAMGLETEVSKLRQKGFRPFLLAAAASVFVSCFSLLLIWSLQPAFAQAWPTTP
jgi:uncharacterized integral membrane protein (TIGR00698 family)